MLPTGWWIWKSFKLDDSVTNFIHPRYSRVKFLILFKSLLGLMGSMLDIFVYVLNFETKLQAAWSVGKKGFPEGVCGLTCFVRCFTLSFGSHKTPWTWEKTNYSFKCRCPSVFLSLSGALREHYLCSTGLAVTWELSPVRPRLLLWTGWPSFFDCPVPSSKELWTLVWSGPSTPDPSYPLTFTLFIGTGMSRIIILGN